MNNLLNEAEESDDESYVVSSLSMRAYRRSPTPPVSRHSRRSAPSSAPSASASASAAPPATQSRSVAPTTQGEEDEDRDPAEAPSLWAPPASTLSPDSLDGIMARLERLQHPHFQGERKGW